MLELLFMLLAGHALADFALQPTAMAKGKNRHNVTKPSHPDAKRMPSWHMWLTAHAFIHGGIVALVLGYWWIGLFEVILHWIIDFHKCENSYGMYTDQALHIVCKLWWLAMFALMAT